MRKMRSTFEWIPLPPFFSAEKDSVLDFSSLLDAPAGKYGRVEVKDDLLYFKGKHKPVRFNGTNLCFSANFPSHEQADLMVEEFARCGFNVLRFHHYDNLLVKHDEIRKDSTELDEQAVDALDYLFAACKNKGIYLITDFYVSRKLLTGEIPEFPDRTVDMQEFKRLVLVNRNAFENLYRFSVNLLNHYNPYTGHLWKEDPALLSINLVNEGVVEAGYGD